jgi:hypothetical protein
MAAARARTTRSLPRKPKAKKPPRRIYAVMGVGGVQAFSVSYGDCQAYIVQRPSQDLRVISYTLTSLATPGGD